jgi:hypothetical protein
VTDASFALQKLVEAAAEHDARLVAEDTVLLDKIGLYVRLRPLQSAAMGSQALFVGYFDASTRRGRSGIGVTCVGFSSDPPRAAADAVANWFLGVLPVLARWRGDHSCLVGTTTFEAPAPSGPRAFEVVKGPVVERGEHDGGPEAAPTTDGYLSLLAEPLRARKLDGTLHWLECFAIRSVDGSIDATCRLDNRDWPPGQQLLAADAADWPGSTPSFHSRRQFLLLVPQNGGAGEPETRSFWARLFGRG